MSNERAKIAELNEKIKKLNLQISRVHDEKDCLIAENVKCKNTIRHLNHEIRVTSNDKDRFFENAQASLKYKKYAFTNSQDIDDTAN